MLSCQICRRLLDAEDFHCGAGDHFPRRALRLAVCRRQKDRGEHLDACGNCAGPPGVAGGKKRVNASRGWLRIRSSIATRCTQETVQNGAQGFVVEYSRSRSAWVYFSSGIAG